MKLQDLITILEHTKTQLGEDAEVLFQYGHLGDAQRYDFGEKGRLNSCLTSTIYDTYCHTTSDGCFVIPIRRIPFPIITEDNIKEYKKFLIEVCNTPNDIIEEKISNYINYNNEVNLDKELAHYPIIQLFYNPQT